MTDTLSEAGYLKDATPRAVAAFEKELAAIKKYQGFLGSLRDDDMTLIRLTKAGEASVLRAWLEDRYRCPADDDDMAIEFPCLAAHARWGVV